VPGAANLQMLSPTELLATVESVPYDPETHEIIHEIKAVTYHRIEVTDKGDHWVARIIFDL
ncbi:MAG: archease, partial [Deltaproteobacteria bacterium]|nr:archease [Deltaproteobacteria bacterium]